MRGAIFILICAIALTNGASIEVQDSNVKISELVRDTDSSETTTVVAEEEGSDESDSEVEDSVAGAGDPSEAAAICAVEGSDETLVSHEICNKYYMCAGGLPVAMDCPPLLLFNNVNSQCDWPENVECGDRTISYETDDEGSGEEEIEDVEQIVNSDPSEAPAVCAASGSEGVLVANEICNRFYICSAGVPVSMNCPSTLMFNYNNGQCDWPESVECGNRTISYETEDEGSGEEEIEDVETIVNGTNSDPSEAPAICATEGSDGILVAHEYCNYFYKCAGFLPVSMKCSANLMYNWVKEQCDWPNNVDCGDRVIHEEEVTTESASDSEDESEDVESDGGNSDPSEAPAICAAAGSDGTLVASENCNQFYNCWNGIPVTLSCPTSLVFNPAINVCDWPHNVDCGDRVTA